MTEKSDRKELKRRLKQARRMAKVLWPGWRRPRSSLSRGRPKPLEDFPRRLLDGGPNPCTAIEGKRYRPREPRAGAVFAYSTTLVSRGRLSRCAPAS
jgi:hypothetical protein